MEHIVQFAVGIDDEGIKRIIETKAADTIITDMEREIRNKLFRAQYYKYNATANDDLSEFSKEVIKGLFDNDREAIIDKAAKLLADSLSRTKAAKEAAARIAEKTVLEVE